MVRINSLINFSKKKLKDVMRPCIFILTIIIIYSIILNQLIKTKDDDPMIMFRSPILGNFINGWTLSHFIFFAYLGYNYQDHELEANSLGVIWELIEWSIGTFFPILFPDQAFKIDPFWTSWYYGKYEDIVMNYLGFKFGKLLFSIT
jgi:hypothetical protein